MWPVAFHCSDPQWRMAQPVEYWSLAGPAMYFPVHIGSESTATQSVRRPSAASVGWVGV